MFYGRRPLRPHTRQRRLNPVGLHADLVPDAEKVIKARDGERVQADLARRVAGCARACIAMVAPCRKFRRGSDQPAKPFRSSSAGKAKLIDTVDDMISVSGGGYTSALDCWPCRFQKMPPKALGF